MNGGKKVKVIKVSGMVFTDLDVFKTVKEGEIVLLNKVLGKGQFGEVRLSYLTDHVEKKPIKLVATKVIDKQNVFIYININYCPQIADAIKSKFLHNQKQQIRNLEILSKDPNNQNIVKFIDSVITRSNFYIVMELCSGHKDQNGNVCGIDLKSIVDSGCLTFLQKVKYLLDIARGIALLFKYNIIHRDIKPQNIIIHQNIAKIGDLGQSKYWEYMKQYAQQHTKGVGSPGYRSIQILKNLNYSIKCDVWSFGVVAYFMFYNMSPYQGCQSLDELINRASIPIKINKNIPVPQFIQQLIKDTVKISEQDRLSATEVLQRCQAYYSQCLEQK